MASWIESGYKCFTAGHHSSKGTLVDWTFEVDGLQRYFRIVTCGDFSLTHHKRMVRDLLSHEEWRPGARTLFDHRLLRFGDIGFAEMLELEAVHVSNDSVIGDGKSAILMSSNDYGLGRQFQNITDAGVSAQIRIFKNEVEALAWLLEDEPRT